MHDYEQFETALVAALLHLHDPTYVPELLLCERLALSSVDAARKTLLDAVNALRPGPDVPPASRAIRMHALLDYRFVQELPQKETARRLGISSRHLRREQQEAIRLLAKNLLARPRVPTVAQPEFPDDSAPEHPSPNSTGEPSAWSEQLRQELTSLNHQSPGLVANVERTMQDVADLAKSVGFGDRSGIPAVQFNLHAPDPDLSAMIHPSVLGQLLITAVEQMASLLLGGAIQMSADRFMRWTRITIVGGPALSNHVPSSDFIRETLATHGGTFTTHSQNERLRFEFLLPFQEVSTVLVADDNVDLVHFYRRYVDGTQYRIVHVAEGSEVVPVACNLRPDVIILDVMLPDINGWLVLQSLRSNHSTREIPVLICSVVRQESLAQRLGAAGYLTKPIHRHDFLDALARVGHPRQA